MSDGAARPVEIRRGAQRAVTSTEWLASRHSFSFGPHYDPANLSFGLLQVHNDDLLAPHTGYDTHAHREMEIVTWVLAGELTHVDSHGNEGVTGPGVIQRMTAGSGIRHSERNEGDVPTRFVQVWLTPDTESLTPDYAHAKVDDRLGGGDLVILASGRPRDVDAVPVRLHQAGAAFSVARVRAGGTVDVPQAPYVHVYLACGAGAWDADPIDEGDAVRLRGRGGTFSARTDCELLVWHMQ
jgi:redox-sensitive bicupin YhaK (pirin superfamily)